jgi:hypothetical protein
VVIACNGAASAIFPVTACVVSGACCAGKAVVWLGVWLSSVLCAWVDLSEVAGVLSTGVVFVVAAVDVALVEVASDAALCTVFANAFVSTGSAGRNGNTLDGERSDCDVGVLAGAVSAVRACGRPMPSALAAAAFFAESLCVFASVVFVAAFVSRVEVDGLACAEAAVDACCDAELVVSERAGIVAAFGDSANAGTPVEGCSVVVLSWAGAFVSPVSLAG